MGERSTHRGIGRTVHLTCRREPLPSDSGAKLFEAERLAAGFATLLEGVSGIDHVDRRLTLSPPHAVVNRRGFLYRSSSSNSSCIATRGYNRKPDLKAGARVKITVEITAQQSPPTQSPVRVQLRDTSLADAPAVVLHEVSTRVQQTTGTVATATFDVADLPRNTTIWAHIDVDGDGKVSKGDYITTRSYPVNPADALLRVEVVRV